MASSNEVIIKVAVDGGNTAKELDKIKEQSRQLEQNLTKAGKASAIAFAAIGTAVGFSVKAFSDFEASFTNVVTLLDQSSFKTATLKDGIKGLSDGVKNLALESGEGFDKLNQGLFDIISSGVPAERAIKTLAAATKLASAGSTDTATAVKALTASMTSFGASAGSATDIAEKFFTAQKFALTKVGDLADNFNKVAGQAYALGQSFDSTLAAAAALTNDGAKPAAEAFTQLKALMTSSVQAQSKLKDESLAVQQAFSLQNIQSKGLVVATQDLIKATGGSAVALQRVLGSQEAVTAALALGGSQAASYAKILAAMNDENERAASFNEALATKQETVEKSLARISQSFNALAITIGEQFAPLINSLADTMVNLAKHINGLDDESKGLLGTLAQFALSFTGIGAAAGLFGGGILKLVSIFGNLNKILLVGRISFAAFWGAATLGLSLVITFLPELITLFNRFLKPIVTPPALKLFDGIQLAFNGLQQGIILLLEGIGYIVIGFNSMTLAAINAANAINRTLGGTTKLFAETAKESQLLVDDAIGKIDLLQDKMKNLEAANRDVRTRFGSRDREEGPKTKEEVAARERLDARGFLGGGMDEASVIKEQEAAKAEALKEGLLAQQEAKDEANATDLEKQKLHNVALSEEDAKAAQKKKDVEAEIRQLEIEEGITRNEVDFEELRKKLETEASIEDEFRTLRAQKIAEEHNNRLRDEKIFGANFAKVTSAFRSADFKAAQGAADQLISLEQSKNATLKGIGKAAAIAKAVMDTAASSIEAFRSQVIPGDPTSLPRAFAAAAAAGVAGAVRIATIAGAQEGGLVGGTGSGDRQLIAAEAGELIVPKPLVPSFLDVVGTRGGDLGGVSQQTVKVDIELTGNAGQFITARQREDRQLLRLTQ